MNKLPAPLMVLCFLLVLSFSSSVVFAETFTGRTVGTGQCVDYARINTGGNDTSAPGIGGDHGAYHIYDNWNYGYGVGSLPEINSLIVIDTSTKLASGHVGIVRSVISRGDGIYELRVDESNWYEDSKETTYSYYLFDSNSMNTKREWEDITANRIGTQNSPLGGTNYPVRGFVYTQSRPPVEIQTSRNVDICWTPQGVSCENAEYWYQLSEPPNLSGRPTPATITDKGSCTRLNQEIETVCSSESLFDAIPEGHFWQTVFRRILFIPTACASNIKQDIVPQTILIDSNGQPSFFLGNPYSSNATGQGYATPPTDTPTPGLPDFSEYSLKLQDTSGAEKYTYYLDDKVEMHHWSQNTGEANWAGSSDLIYVRFYLSKGYKARNSADDWVRVGTEQIQKGNLNVGAIKHEWHTLDLGAHSDEIVHLIRRKPSTRSEAN